MGSDVHLTTSPSSKARPGLPWWLVIANVPVAFSKASQVFVVVLAVPLTSSSCVLLFISFIKIKKSSVSLCVQGVKRIMIWWELPDCKMVTFSTFLRNTEFAGSSLLASVGRQEVWAEAHWTPQLLSYRSLKHSFPTAPGRVPLCSKTQPWPVACPSPIHHPIIPQSSTWTLAAPYPLWRGHQKHSRAGDRGQKSPKGPRLPSGCEFLSLLSEKQHKIMFSPDFFYSSTFMSPAHMHLFFFKQAPSHWNQQDSVVLWGRHTYAWIKLIFTEGSFWIGFWLHTYVRRWTVRLSVTCFHEKKMVKDCKVNL